MKNFYFFCLLLKFSKIFSEVIFLDLVQIFLEHAFKGRVIEILNVFSAIFKIFYYFLKFLFSVFLQFFECNIIFTICTTLLSAMFRIPLWLMIKLIHSNSSFEVINQ